MSGPKSGSYRVVSAAELARRAHERALRLASASHDQLRAVLADAAAECRRSEGLVVELPTLPDWPVDSTTTEEYERLDGELSHLLSETRQVMSKARRVRQRGMIAAGLSRTTSDRQAIVASDLLGSDGPARPATTVYESALEVAEQLRHDAPPEYLASVDEILGRLRDAPTRERQGVWLTELRHAVDLANRRAAQAETDAERARHLLADLRTHARDAAALDEALAGVVDRRTELTDQLVEEVRRAVTDGLAEADAAFVTSSVAEVLSDLGYVVDEGFATVLARGGLAHVGGADASWDDHGVRVRLDSERRELMFNVVRSRDRASTPARDEALEADWCSDLPAMLDGFDDRGIDLEIATRVEPGELAVMEVDPAHLGLETSETEAAAVAKRHAAEQRQRRRRAQRRPRERGL